MKKLKLLAIAILIGGTSAFALEINNSDPVIPLAMLRAQIAELLPDEYFGDIDQTEVKILFTYSTSGEIVVLKVGTNNKLVKKYINKNMNWKKVELPGEVGKVYKIILKIQPEK